MKDPMQETTEAAISQDQRTIEYTTGLTPPTFETQPLTGDVASGRKLTGAQMFELGDMFLRQLRTMGPEAYRPEVMKTMIGEIKAQRMASDFNRNRDILAQKLYNIQRNLGAQQNERPDAGSDGSGDQSGSEDD